MQTKTFKNFLCRLLTLDKLNLSQVRSIKRTPEYNTLIAGGIIEEKRPATGGGSVYVKNRQALEKLYRDKFPEESKDLRTAVDSVHAFRDSKATKRESQNIILIRGRESVCLNGIQIDLKIYTDNYGTFSASLKSLLADKVCFVENLDSYLLAERVVNSDYIFIHTYGGMGKSIPKRVIAKEILVFPDYDYVGLRNYLLVKSVHSQAKLFIPDNYELLFRTKSRTIKTKHGREQQPNKKVVESYDEAVVKIRTDISKNKRFLEQQAIFS